MAWWLTALADFTEDTGLILIPHRLVTATCNSNSRGALAPSSGFLGYEAQTCTGRTLRQIKINRFLTLKKAQIKQ